MIAVVRSSSLVMTPSNSLTKRQKVSTDRLEREPKETYLQSPLFARHVCHDPWSLAVCFSICSDRRSVRLSAPPSFLDRSILKSGFRRDHLLRLVRRDRRTRESASGQESQRPEFARYSESSWTPPSSTFSDRRMAQRRAQPHQGRAPCASRSVTRQRLSPRKDACCLIR
jgi:hypothetical protein